MHPWYSMLPAILGNWNQQRKWIWFTLGVARATNLWEQWLRTRTMVMDPKVTI